MNRFFLLPFLWAVFISFSFTWNAGENKEQLTIDVLKPEYYWKRIKKNQNGKEMYERLEYIFSFSENFSL